MMKTLKFEWILFFKIAWNWVPSALCDMTQSYITHRTRSHYVLKSIVLVQDVVIQTITWLTRSSARSLIAGACAHYNCLAPRLHFFRTCGNEFDVMGVLRWSSPGASSMRRRHPDCFTWTPCPGESSSRLGTFLKAEQTFGNIVKDHFLHSWFSPNLNIQKGNLFCSIGYQRCKDLMMKEKPIVVNNVVLSDDWEKLHT